MIKLYDGLTAEEMYNKYIMSLHQIAHKYNVQGLDHEDLVSEGTLHFFKILDDWDESRGCFTTFLYASMFNFYGCLVRNNKSIKRGGNIQHVSLDSPVPNAEDLVLSDFIPDKRYKRDDSLLIAIDDYCSKLTGADKEIVENFIYNLGYKQSDLAKKYNKSQAWVSRLLNRHCDNIKRKVG